MSDRAVLQAARQRVRSTSADLFLALDPLSLGVAFDACRQLRERGLRPALAYDRSLSPGQGAGAEADALCDIDLATAASVHLAADHSWPVQMRGRVPVIYTSPLELTSPDRLGAPLREALQALDAPRVGLFLPRRSSRAQEAALRATLKLLEPMRPTVFGGGHGPVRRRLGGSRTRRWAHLGEETVARVVPTLDAVVCESVWTGSHAPSAAAVLAASEGIGLVTSPEVSDGFDSAFVADPTSPRSVADAIRAAVAGQKEQDGAAGHPRPATRSAFAYRSQVHRLRRQFAGEHRPKLGIGPRNGNGQAWAWAEAVRRQAPGIDVEAFAAEYVTGRLAMVHDTDVSIPLEDWRDRGWQRWWAHRLQAQFSHVLIEQGLTACGLLNGRHFFDDLPGMLRGGLRVGLVFRGSEIRDPSAHAARERWSPFADPDEPDTAKLQVRFEAERSALARFDVPVFVTTLDLLDDVPHATWLPHVIDTDLWAPGPPTLQRPRPVVLHAPSRTGLMKGSHWVDEVCQPLHDVGVIEYRRLHGVPFSDMPGHIRNADIVVDQLALGSYGVLALQAMASERLVVGHISDRARSRVSDPIPVLEAEPSELRRVLEDTLTDRAASRDLARAGRAYVHRYHCGQESADRLLEHLIGE